MDGGHPQDYPGKSGVGEQFLFYITSNVNNLFKKFVIIIHLSRFVIVTAEYNCSLPPALTNLFDYFPPASFRQRAFVFFFVLVFSLCVLSLLLSALRQFKTRYFQCSWLNKKLAHQFTSHSGTSRSA